LKKNFFIENQENGLGKFMLDKKSSEYINELQDRLKHQEEVNSFVLEGINMAAALMDIQPSINKLQTSSLILEKTCSGISGLINFHAMGMYLVDEQDNDFYPAYLTPEKHGQVLHLESDRLIDLGFFSSAIREKRTLILASSNREMRVVLQVLSSSSRIRGMFIGLLKGDVSTIPDVSWALLNLILSSTANTLENFELYRLFRETNTQLKKNINKTRASEVQAGYDRLTRLPNRDTVIKRLESEIRSCLDTVYETRAAFILIDLDQFKEVNENLSHQAGNDLLINVGSRLQEIIEDSECLGRLGGDEFAIVLSGPDAEERAREKAGKILEIMSRPFEVQEHSILLGISIGISVFPDHGKNLGQLLSRADMAMYAARRMNTGYALYDHRFDSPGLNRLSLISDLKKALADNRLSIYFQPVILLSDGKVCNVEALIRWLHPAKGFIPPEEFIPLAERAGLSQEISTAVLQKTLAQIRDWQIMGINLVGSINLTNQDILDVRLPDRISGVLEELGLESSFLELEIAESALTEAMPQVQSIMETMQAMKISICLDNFGTGNSSIVCLSELPVKTLKIDPGLVLDLDSNIKNRRMIKSMIDLAHNLDMQVIAEGVGTQSSLDILKNIGCDMAQGYWIGKPQSAEELTSRLNSFSR